ncbi:unnamed protein product [Durusdinium trenchii]|uniref:Uncharacterized protein n=1 Tax=Durusdinium trenchii TaxID=1381693 RepID=A0ABP0QBK0_9DINO
MLRHPASAVRSGLRRKFEPDWLHTVNMYTLTSALLSARLNLIDPSFVACWGYETATAGLSDLLASIGARQHPADFDKVMDNLFHPNSSEQDSTGMHEVHEALQTAVGIYNELRGANCGCNVNFFLVSMPAGPAGQYNDHYCDANCVGGNCCAEFDINGMNDHALQITNHNCYGTPSKGSCDGDGNPMMRFGPPEYGPGSWYTIDTTKPFQFALQISEELRELGFDLDNGPGSEGVAKKKEERHLEAKEDQKKEVRHPEASKERSSKERHEEKAARPSEASKSHPSRPVFHGGQEIEAGEGLSREDREKAAKSLAAKKLPSPPARARDRSPRPEVRVKKEEEAPDYSEEEWPVEEPGVREVCSQSPSREDKKEDYEESPTPKKRKHRHRRDRSRGEGGETPEIPITATATLERTSP